MDEQGLGRVHGKVRRRRRPDAGFSTTIIERGLDIPNANHDHHDRADRFGLADLVSTARAGGTSDKAMLIYASARYDDGRKRSRRINAIKNNYSGLGARNLELRLRELEIRGAGNILGTAAKWNIITCFDLIANLLQLQQAAGGIAGEKEFALGRCCAPPRLSPPTNPNISLLRITTERRFYPGRYSSQTQTRIQGVQKTRGKENSKEAFRSCGPAMEGTKFGQHPQAMRKSLTLNDIKLMAAAEGGFHRSKGFESHVMRGGDYFLIGPRDFASPD